MKLLVIAGLLWVLSFGHGLWGSAEEPASDLGADAEEVLPDLEVPPKLLELAPLKYPKKMLKQGIEDRVIVQLVINADGSVRDLEALRYQHEAFVKPALQALKKSVWKPGELNGRPVASRVRVPVRFTLAD